MAAGDSFFDAAVEPTPPPVAPPKPQASKPIAKARTIEPKAPPAPPPPPPTPTPTPAVVDEDEDEEQHEDDEDEEDDARLRSRARRRARKSRTRPIEESPIAPVKVEAPRPVAKPVPPAPVAAPAAPVAPPPVTRAPEKAKEPEVVKVVPAKGLGFRLPTTDMLEPPSPGDKFAIDEEKLRDERRAPREDARATTASPARSRRSSRARPSRRTRSRRPRARRSARSRRSPTTSRSALAQQGAHHRADPGQEPHRLRAPEREAHAREPARARRGSPLPEARRRRCPVVLGRDIVGEPVYADLASHAARDRRRRDRRRQERRAQRDADVACSSGARPTSCACS